MWIEKETSIAEIKTLLDNGYEVEVDSPDGYVPVNFFINKGMYDEYVLITKSPKHDSIHMVLNHYLMSIRPYACQS